MDGEWTTKSLGEVVALQRGHDLPAQVRGQGSVPIMGSAGITGFHDKAKDKGPGVIIGRSGNAMGEVHFTEHDYWPLNTCLYVTDFKGNNPKFVYYLLKTINFDQFNSGSAQKSLNRNAVYPFQVYLPESVEEQKKIADILTSIEDKIALNRQINQTLEAMAQALFKSWFVDFEPVQAKIAALETGEDPTRAAMRAISGKTDTELGTLQTTDPDAYAQLEATASLFPDALVESELGLVPEGWEVGKLGDLIEFNPRRSLKKNALAPYLDMKNVPTEGHLAEEVIEREFGSGSKFINGDTLLARITPCLENGKTAYVDFLNTDEVGWGSTEYIVMRPKTGFPTVIAYFIARYEPFRQAAIQSMTGTSGRQRANSDALGNLDWVVPSQIVAKAFGEIANTVMTKIKSNGGQNRTLATLRDTLLPKLLSGELSVAEVEESVADVA